MVSEVGKVLLDAAKKGYTIEVAPYLAGGQSAGLKLCLYDEHGERIIKRIATSYDFLHTGFNPVCHNLREMITLADFAGKDE